MKDRSNTSWKGLLALGLGAYVLFLIARFPAGLAYQWLAPEGVRLDTIQGTVWRGSARAARIDVLTLGRTGWRMRPWSLLRGRLAYAVDSTHPEGFLEGNIAMGFGGLLTAEDLSASLPLAALAGLLPVESIDAQLTMRLERLVLREGWPERVVGEVALSGLLISFPVASELGDFQTIFEEESQSEDEVLGRIRDTDSPIELQGTLRLQPERGYSIDATLQARSDAPQELAGMLSLLGPADASGRRRLSLAGSL